MSTLTNDRIEQIEDTAETVIFDTFKELPQSPPINLIEIVKHFNLKLIEGNFGNIDVDGAYKRAESTIFISSSIPYTRKSFTIAHELGHHFLHKEKNDEILFRSSTYSSNDPIETEANWFAASLLMPKYLFPELLKLDLDSYTLAKIFGVSKSAIGYRLDYFLREFPSIFEVELKW